MDGPGAALAFPRTQVWGDAAHTSLGDAGTLDGVIDYSTLQPSASAPPTASTASSGANHFESVAG
jgi:hypothetical protein